MLLLLLPLLLHLLLHYYQIYTIQVGYPIICSLVRLRATMSCIRLVPDRLAGRRHARRWP